MKRKRYSRKFQRMAVERMRTCDDVGELARELGVTRRCLYKWRTKLPATKPPGNRFERFVERDAAAMPRTLGALAGTSDQTSRSNRDFRRRKNKCRRVSMRSIMRDCHCAESADRSE